jgi:hypothetical protein
MAISSLRSLYRGPSCRALSRPRDYPDLHGRLSENRDLEFNVIHTLMEVIFKNIKESAAAAWFNKEQCRNVGVGGRRVSLSGDLSP